MPRFLIASVSVLALAACQSQPGGDIAATPSNDVVVASERIATLDDGTRQIEYAGSAADYTIVRNVNGTLSITKPNGSTDIIADLDGIWFRDEAKWYAVDSLATPAIVTGITDGDDRIFGTNNDDIIDGLGGQDIVVGSRGSDTIYLGDNFDQIDYTGFSEDYRFVRTEDGSVVVTKPDGGVDSLIGVDGVWFVDEARWYPMQAIAMVLELTPITDGDDVITGTPNDDLINGMGGEDVVYESGGNDLIDLGDGYDQVDYKGALSDYIFTPNENGSLLVTKPGGGVDTLTGVDGVWFSQDETWMSTKDLMPGKPS